MLSNSRAAMFRCHRFELCLLAALLALGCSGKTGHEGSARPPDAGGVDHGGASSGGATGQGGASYTGGTTSAGATATASDAAVASCSSCLDMECPSAVEVCNNDAACSRAFDTYLRCGTSECLTAFLNATMVGTPSGGSELGPLAECIVAQCSRGECSGGGHI